MIEISLELSFVLYLDSYLLIIMEPILLFVCSQLGQISIFNYYAINYRNFRRSSIRLADYKIEKDCYLNHSPRWKLGPHTSQISPFQTRVSLVLDFHWVFSYCCIGPWIPCQQNGNERRAFQVNHGQNRSHATKYSYQFVKPEIYSWEII